MSDPVLDALDAAELIPGFTASELPREQPDHATLGAAGRNTRAWTSVVSGPLVPGSDVHRREICRMFRETFNPYRPSMLEWPKLEPEVLKRIVELPIWDIAVQTEGKARLRMATYAATLDDTDMRDALALNASEENRHKEVLSRMVEAYGVELASEPPYVHPKDTEWAYLVTGFSECIDSFFAFGRFEVVQRSRLFPPGLIDTFEPVMQEECRHILLFANGVAWHRARLAWLQRIRFELSVAAVWVFLCWERIGLARELDAEGKAHKQDHKFVMNGAHSVTDVEISAPELMRVSLAENDRRFSGYDARLLRLMLRFVLRFVLRLMREKKR